MSIKEDDKELCNEYSKYQRQIYNIQSGMQNQIYKTFDQSPSFMIPPGSDITVSGNGTGGITSTGKFTPPCAMVTDMPYFVLWYDTIARVYVGTWCADDEAAIAEAQAIQNDKSKHCGQVLIMERGQQWLRTWERR